MTEYVPSRNTIFFNLLFFCDHLHVSKNLDMTNLIIMKNKKSTGLQSSASFGGDKRDRTADLLNAIQALSQLSYTPICDMSAPQRM